MVLKLTYDGVSFAVGYLSAVGDVIVSLLGIIFHHLYGTEFVCELS